MKTIKRTLCNRDCPDACGILATVENNRVVRLAGDPDHPVTQGFLCDRTGRFLDLQYGPDRITSPLRRKGNDLVAVSWDEALDFVAERLLAIRRESGPDAILHAVGGGTLGMLQHLSHQLFERFGPVAVTQGSICSGAASAAQTHDFGISDSHDLFDLLNSRHILIWGKNLYTSNAHLVPVLRDARAKGARLVLIDPVHHRTAQLCEAHHALMPGGDAALAMAVARVLFDRDWIDPAASEYCDGLDEFERLVRSRSISSWCAMAGLSVDVARDLAARLHDGPTAILVGWGMGRRVNGGAIVRAVDALGAISGNLGVAGGGVSYDYQRRRGFALTREPRPGKMPRGLKVARLGPEILAATDPPIRAIWIAAANPVAMQPDAHAMAKALRTRDLVVVVDPFLTDTARLADVVLPTTTLLESDDLLGAYGHHWIGASTPVVDPPDGVRSDLEILQALAPRLGMGEMLAGSARTWKQRLIGPELIQHGVTLDRLEHSVVRNPLAPEILFADRRFPTPSGRVNLITQMIDPPLVASPTSLYPLWLMSLSTPRAQCSQWSRPQSGPATVTVHPDAPPGLPNDSPARLESRLGTLTVRVRHDAAQRRDVAIIPKGGHYFRDQCANVLIKACFTDLGHGGALYDERVRLVPIIAPEGDG